MKLNQMFVLLILFLSACGGAPTGPSPVADGPTVDPNLVFTSGAQTVVAQITLDAASRPIPTAALPPTQTQNALPTFPLLGTPGTVIPAVGTQIVQPGAAITSPAMFLTLPSLATVAPAANAAPVVAAIPDRMEWIKNIPPDKSKVPIGRAFKITWTIKNTGTTTWTNLYSYKFYAGTQLSISNSYPILKDVKPNATVDLTIDAIAPSTPGDVYSLWVLQNPQGVNLKPGFDITLTVQ